jgi:hypothetical protein
VLPSLLFAIGRLTPFTGLPATACCTSAISSLAAASTRSGETASKFCERSSSKKLFTPANQNAKPQPSLESPKMLRISATSFLGDNRRQDPASAPASVRPHNALPIPGLPGPYVPILTDDVAKKSKTGSSILLLYSVWCWSNNANECAWLPEGACKYPHSSALRIPENCYLNSRPYQWDWTSLRPRRKRSKLDFASLLSKINR